MNNPRTAVVIGAGAIGCGVLVEQLGNAGYAVTLITRTPRSAQDVRRHGVELSYTGEAGRASGNRTLRPVDVLDIDRTEEVADRIARTGLVGVAIGTRAPAVAPVLARGLAQRRTPVDVLVVDNRPDAATHLRAAVAEHDPGDLVHGFVSVLVDRIVTRTDRADGSRHLLSEPAGQIFADAHAFRAPPPALAQLRLVERFPHYVTHKLCVFSAGHAALAYLGRLRGHALMASAAVDPEVFPVVLAAMCEGQRAVRTWFGDSSTNAERELAHCLERYADPQLGDTVARVGRDPVRKLSRADRISGPARLCLTTGYAVPALATVAGAALLALEASAVVPDRATALIQASSLAVDHPFIDQTLAAASLLDAGHTPLGALRALEAPARVAERGWAS